MVWQRILYGSLMLVGLVVLVAADGWLSRPDLDAVAIADILGHGGLTTVVFGLIALLGAAEFCRLARQAGHHPSLPWILATVGLMVASPWLAAPAIAPRLAPLGTLGAVLARLDAALPAFALLGTGGLMVRRQRTAGAVADFAVNLAVIFYIGFLGSFAVRLRCWPPGALGAWVLLATLLVVKVTDIGAYFAGLSFGRRLLIPKISPKKTWEGLFGGLVAASISSACLFRVAVPITWEDGTQAWLTAPQAVVFGLVMAVVGQLGDLVESVFKRDSGVKDSSKLIPTFGGILDLIDSPLACLPVAYGLLRWWTGR